MQLNIIPPNPNEPPSESSENIYSGAGDGGDGGGGEVIEAAPEIHLKWTISQEKLIRSWCSVLEQLKSYHLRYSRKFSIAEKIIWIPNLILQSSFVVSTTIDSKGSSAPYIVASIISSCLIALEKFLDFKTKSARHSKLSNDCWNLYSEISFQLSLPRDMRTDAGEFINKIRSLYNDIVAGTSGITVPFTIFMNKQVSVRPARTDLDVPIMQRFVRGLSAAAPAPRTPNMIPTMAAIAPTSMGEMSFGHPRAPSITSMARTSKHPRVKKLQPSHNPLIKIPEVESLPSIQRLRPLAVRSITEDLDIGSGVGAIRNPREFVRKDSGGTANGSGGETAAPPMNVIGHKQHLIRKDSGNGIVKYPQIRKGSSSGACVANGSNCANGVNGVCGAPPPVITKTDAFLPIL